jgi:hypothetical protein
MEFAHMLTNYIYEKASLLASIPFFIALPIRSVSNKNQEEPQGKGDGDDEAQGSSLDLHKPAPKSKGLPIVALTSAFALSGCTGSTYTSHFDCPMGEGAGCASISKVNKMIDRREIDLSGDDASITDGNSITRTPVSQVYVYYGPDQLSRLIPTNAMEGN